MLQTEGMSKPFLHNHTVITCI
ncbi:unnamed protein product [Blumeria hordei]|uniref:Uncharacterized protein n=1 Tax=Blumeria hordei TaxID=2867405 RepID=A0A383UMH8_BLUHO|nr:unnamed protein product [Blumeria hordei]